MACRLGAAASASFHRQIGHSLFGRIAQSSQAGRSLGGSAGVVMIDCQCLCVLGDVGLKLCVVVVAVCRLCAVKLLGEGRCSVQAGVLLSGRVASKSSYFKHSI